jgi:hypothetical protein
MLQSKPKVLIYGSCVSRDAFGDQYAADLQFELVDYLARSSLATAFGRGDVKNINFDAIVSPFQRRMVRSDVLHGLVATISTTAYDILLLDLIDERFSVFVDEYGALCTVTGELLSSGFDPNGRPGKMVSPFTDAAFELWERGWNALVLTLASTDSLEKLLINEVYWSKASADGIDYLPHYSAQDIERANRYLTRLYARMREDLPEQQFLRFDAQLLEGACEHRWGRSPFHYVDAYYTGLLEKLARRTIVHQGETGSPEVQENIVGFVKYLQERFLPSRNKLLHEPAASKRIYTIERAILQKPSRTLEVAVCASRETVIRMETTVDGDFGGSNNLLLVVSGDGLADADMQAKGYMKSWVGFFRYLKSDIRNGQLAAEFRIDIKIASFKILTWNFDGPVLFERLRFEADEVELDSPLFDAQQPDEGRPMTITREPALKANFLLKAHRCGPQCVIHCDKWFESMDAYAERHDPKLYGRQPVFVEATTGELLPASLQKAKPAFLVIPRTIDEYLYQIGDKSRNMLHKAQRIGYEFREVGPEGFEQDIYAIRTSDPMRQGRPIPQYYYSNPPIYVLKPSPVGCEYHTERFFGIFQNERLVSYITLFMFGGFAQINHILCHKEHVKHGVMNLNVLNVVDQLIRHFPWVRAINYLYVNEDGLGIDLFKRGVGFKAERFLVYDSALEASQPVPEADKTLPAALPVAANKVPVRPRRKIAKWDFVHATLSREQLAAQMTAKLGRSWIELPAPAEADFVQFCSNGLNDATGAHPAGTCFAVPFPSRAHHSTHPAAADYLAKRFKGNPIPQEGFAMGFKGGNFRALAYFGIENDSYRFFDGRLVLEKLD